MSLALLILNIILLGISVLMIYTSIVHIQAGLNVDYIFYLALALFFILVSGWSLNTVFRRRRLL